VREKRECLFIDEERFVAMFQFRCITIFEIPLAPLYSNQMSDGKRMASVKRNASDE